MSKLDEEISERVKKMSPAAKKAWAAKKINPALCHRVRLTAGGPRICGNFSTPSKVGHETNYVFTCTLRKGHKGPHRTTFMDHTIRWQWGRHQTCHFS